MKAKNITCSVAGCSKTYTSAFSMRKHVDTYHKRVKRHACTYCNKTFAYKHTVLEHIAKHEVDNQDDSQEIHIPNLTDLLLFMGGVVDSRVIYPGPSRSEVSW